MAFAPLKLAAGPGVLNPWKTGEEHCSLPTALPFASQNKRPSSSALMLKTMGGYSTVYPQRRLG
jgi:hypothetical protein